MSDAAPDVIALGYDGGTVRLFSVASGITRLIVRFYRPHSRKRYQSVLFIVQVDCILRIPYNVCIHTCIKSHVLIPVPFP